MDTQQDRRDIEYDLDKPRIAPFKHTFEELITKQLSWCNFKACSEKGFAILSNSIACNCSFKHTTSDLYRESGMHEKKGRTHCKRYQSTRSPRVTCAELASRSEGCTCFGIEKMTVRTKFMSIGRLVAAVVQIFESQAFHIPWNKSLSNSKVTQEHVAEGLWEIGGDQPLQSRIQGFHYWDGQYRNLRVPRDFFEETMSRLRFTLGNWWSHVAHVENACSLQKEIDSWTNTDVTHCRFL